MVRGLYVLYKGVFFLVDLRQGFVWLSVSSCLSTCVGVVLYGAPGVLICETHCSQTGSDIGEEETQRLYTTPLCTLANQRGYIASFSLDGWL